MQSMIVRNRRRFGEFVKDGRGGSSAPSRSLLALDDESLLRQAARDPLREGRPEFPLAPSWAAPPAPHARLSSWLRSLRKAAFRGQAVDYGDGLAAAAFLFHPQLRHDPRRDQLGARRFALHLQSSAGQPQRGQILPASVEDTSRPPPFDQPMARSCARTGGVCKGERELPFRQAS